MSKQISHSLILLLTATIWGVAFVAQSAGMDYVGPFTFTFTRSLIAGVFLIPCIILLKRIERPKQEKKEFTNKDKKTLIIGGICCGLALGIASLFQQFGIIYTSVGKAGFITAFYIIIVPILGIIMGKRSNPLVWLSIIIALSGLYFLCINGSLTIELGDFLILICAFCFSGHILIIDYFSQRTDAVIMSCIQFFIVALICFIPMLIFERPSLSSITDAWLPILYAGILSSGVGYTLQIIGQKGLNPTVASLIMSLESVISVLAGMILLGQTLSKREIIGCILMFTAIILSQLPYESFKKRIFEINKVKN